jgi:hypothetical protein
MLQNAEPPAQRSWLAELLAAFDRDNDELAARTRTALDAIVGVPPRHARMLNTLSLLEHMGSHKIMATQHAAGIDQATLKHVAEEAHHAYFMKRQAEKTAERPLEYVADDLLAPAAARMYFQRLESAIARAVGAGYGTRAVYLYMSMIVEFRALWFYGLYQLALERARHGLSLRRVLGEERAHLDDIAVRLEVIGARVRAQTPEFLAAERRLFVRLLSAIENAAPSVH